MRIGRLVSRLFHPADFRILLKNWEHDFQNKNLFFTVRLNFIQKVGDKTVTKNDAEKKITPKFYSKKWEHDLQKKNNFPDTPEFYSKSGRHDFQKKILTDEDSTSTREKVHGMQKWTFIPREDMQK